MKNLICFAILSISLASCTKQEFCQEPAPKNTSTVQFRVSVSSSESFKQTPSLTISGTINGVPFSKKAMGTECLSDMISVMKNQNADFTIDCISSLSGNFNVDVIVDGDVMMSFGSSCAMDRYERKNEVLYL